jgi:hypothetical protein
MRVKLAIAAVTLLATAGSVKADHKKLVLAGLPCSKLLSAYGTSQFQSFIPSIVSDISDRDIGGRLGSDSNITDYILSECRLNERFTVETIQRQTTRPTTSDSHRWCHKRSTNTGGLGGF